LLDFHLLAIMRLATNYLSSFLKVVKPKREKTDKYIFIY
jgi:hypothetical protein